MVLYEFVSKENGKTLDREYAFFSYAGARRKTHHDGATLGNQGFVYSVLTPIQLIKRFATAKGMVCQVKASSHGDAFRTECIVIGTKS